MLTLTRQQVREVDRIAIEELGVPGVVLMENAGRSVADHVLDILESDMHLVPQDSHVAVLCGGGNNGGDGYVIARHLANAGVNVTAYVVKPADELTGDAATNHAIAQKMGLVLPLEWPDQFITEPPDQKAWHVVVDALLGTGFTGQVRDDVAQVIEACNGTRDRGATIVAVDVPSGLDCDSGQPSNATVAADLTVTFVAMKRGFEAPEAEPFLGQVVVVDIGAPPQLIGRVIR